MREIVTVQIGRQANYVGTHFWNAQQSYHTFGSDELSPADHDVSFRQGVAHDGSDTYLPRTLIYDLRGGFGSLASVNAVGAEVDDGGDDISEDNIWSGRLDRLQSRAIEPSPYLKSLIAQQALVFPTTATTPYFSDFASTFYHPRSLVPVALSHPVLDPASQASTNDLPSFNTHADGQSLFEEINAAHDIYDRDLRLWIEECDSMQGIQLFTSADDAWAGFSSAYVEEIRDQLGKGSLWVWGLSGLEQREQNQSTRLLKTLNNALALAAFNAHASLHVPVGLPSFLDPSVQLDRSSLWHTSALASAVIESATLPLRLRTSGDGRAPVLGDWEDALGDGGRRKVAEVAMESGASASGAAMTNGHANGETASGADTDARMTGEQLIEDEADEQETANVSLPIELFQPNTSLAQTPRQLRPKTFARIDAFRGPSWAVPTSSSILEQDLRFLRRGRPVIEAFQSNTPLFPLVATFPHIFTNSAGPSQTEVPGMRAHTSLRTSSGIANWIRNIEATVRRTPVAMLAAAMPGTERESLVNDLDSMAEMYVEGWDSGDEDSDEDE